MDYTTQSLAFKIRKVLRYVRLYGPARTRAKVQGQLHMKRTFPARPAPTRKFSDLHTVALLGCGNYAFSNIAYYLNRTHGPVIGGCMDKNGDRAASLAQQYDVPFHTDNAAEIIEDDRYKLVYIASNHASHADYAVEALKKGKHVYIEKPHVVSFQQLDTLVETMRSCSGKVFLGFNRPGSRFGRLILDHLGREEGAGMYNWFVAGHAIEPDHWYFQEAEGGRVLGNLCHWTDFVLRMAGERFPIRITPTRGAKSDADIAVTFTFADETIAVITFSAKGHTFEGVKEHLSAHRGNCLLSMRDYETLTIEVGEQKHNYTNVFRDHGHKRNIIAAYDSVKNGSPYDREAEQAYIANSAWLFLKTREALETNTTLEIQAYGR